MPVIVARRPLAYASSYALEELELADGRRLVRKDLSALVVPGAKPDFVVDPRREIAVYREVVGPLGLDAPRMVACGPTWLVLEHVEGEPLWQAAGIEPWERAARWLARLHRVPVPRSRALLRHDARWMRRFLGRALEAEPRVAAVAAAAELAAERLAALPPSLVHGEAYPSNLLVTAGGICALDWEMAGVGAGVLDLAALTSGRWDDATRGAVVAAYEEEADAAIAPADLAAARLVIAVQWLGWSRDWSPPAAHAHDWLADALRWAQARLRSAGWRVNTWCTTSRAATCAPLRSARPRCSDGG